MSNKVPAQDIERSVGVKRHATEHWARAVHIEERVYILHSQECKDHYTDLRLCPYSRALALGIDEKEWPKDEPLTVRVLDGRLTPVWVSP